MSYFIAQFSLVTAVSRLISPAARVVDELKIADLRRILRAVIVGSIIGRQEIVAALPCKYKLLRLRNPFPTLSSTLGDWRRAPALVP
jgi:hypothetical protein